MDAQQTLEDLRAPVCSCHQSRVRGTHPMAPAHSPHHALGSCSLGSHTCFLQALRDQDEGPQDAGLHSCSPKEQAFPNPFPITEANSWMRTAPFPSFPALGPSWVQAPALSSTRGRFLPGRTEHSAGKGQQAPKLGTFSFPQHSDRLPDNLRSPQADEAGNCSPLTLTPWVSRGTASLRTAGAGSGSLNSSGHLHLLPASRDQEANIQQHTAEIGPWEQAGERWDSAGQSGA